MESPGDSARDRLLDAAHRIFAEAGFRGLTTRRVAAAAGVNEVTLFRHFPTKEALVLAALDRAADRSAGSRQESTLPDQPRDPRAELRAFLLPTFRGFFAVRDEVRTGLFEWGHHPGLDERLVAIPTRIFERLLAYVRAARDAGLIRRDLHPAVVTNALLAPLFADGLMRDMMPAHYPLDLEPTLDAYLTILIDGLLPIAEQPTTEYAQ